MVTLMVRVNEPLMRDVEQEALIQDELALSQKKSRICAEEYSTYF